MLWLIGQEGRKRDRLSFSGSQAATAAGAIQLFPCQEVPLPPLPDELQFGTRGEVLKGEKGG